MRLELLKRVPWFIITGSESELANSAEAGWRRDNAPVVRDSQIVISENLIRQYERDGAVLVKGAIEADVAADVLQNLDDLIESRDDRWTTIRDGGFSDRHLWPTMPWMYDFCANSALPEIVARLMRSREARLYFDHTFVRDAGTAQTTPWHQDRPYWPFQGKQIASVWVALTACNQESSGLRFVRGSHAAGKVYRPIPFGNSGGSSEFLDQSDALDVMPDIDAAPDEHDLLCWDVEPGDVIVFGAEVIHGASENTNNPRRRAALSIRYVGDDARWDPRAGTDPMVSDDMVSFNPGDAPHDDKWFPRVWSST